MQYLGMGIAVVFLRYSKGAVKQVNLNLSKKRRTIMRKENVWKRMMTVILLGVMVVSFAACGGSDKDGGGSSSADSDVKVVKVGTGNGAAPFCYLDEDGNSIGYDIDVLKELDKRLEQYSFDIQAMDFSTLIVSIDSGSLDLLSHQLVKSKARKEKYLFPDQYYSLSPMSLCVRNDSGIKSMEDMAGKAIDQDPSAYEYQMLVAYNAEHPGKELTINAVSDQSVADGYKKVSNGQVDAALTYQATYDSVIGELGIDNLSLTEVVMVEDTYMMLSKGNEDLRDAVDGALKDMIADGTLSEISNKWFREDIFTNYKDMVQIVVE